MASPAARPGLQIPARSGAHGASNRGSGSDDGDDTLSPLHTRRHGRAGSVTSSYSVTTAGIVSARGAGGVVAPGMPMGIPGFPGGVHSMAPGMAVMLDEIQLQRSNGAPATVAGARGHGAGAASVASGGLERAVAGGHGDSAAPLPVSLSQALLHAAALVRPKREPPSVVDFVRVGADSSLLARLDCDTVDGRTLVRTPYGDRLLGPCSGTGRALGTIERFVYERVLPFMSDDGAPSVSSESPQGAAAAGISRTLAGAAAGAGLGLGLALNLASGPVLDASATTSASRSHTLRLRSEAADIVRSCVGGIRGEDVVLFAEPSAGDVGAGGGVGGGGGGIACTYALRDALRLSVVDTSQMGEDAVTLLRYSRPWAVPAILVGPGDAAFIDVAAAWGSTLVDVAPVRGVTRGASDDDADVGSSAWGHGEVDLRHLEEQLHKFRDRDLVIGVFSAGSAVTGEVWDDAREVAAADGRKAGRRAADRGGAGGLDAVAEVLHNHGAYMVVDFAAAGPHVAIDMHPGRQREQAKGYRGKSGAEAAAAGKDLPSHGAASSSTFGSVPAMTTAQRKAAVHRRDAVFLQPRDFVGGSGAASVLVASVALLTKSADPGTHVSFGLDRTADGDGVRSLSTALALVSAGAGADSGIEADGVGNSAAHGGARGGSGASSLAAMRCAIAMSIKAAVGAKALETVNSVAVHSALSVWSDNPRLALVGASDGMYAGTTTGAAGGTAFTLGRYWAARRLPVVSFGVRWPRDSPVKRPAALLAMSVMAATRLRTMGQALFGAANGGPLSTKAVQLAAVAELTAGSAGVARSASLRSTGSGRHMETGPGQYIDGTTGQRMVRGTKGRSRMKREQRLADKAAAKDKADSAASGVGSRHWVPPLLHPAFIAQLLHDLYGLQAVAGCACTAARLTRRGSANGGVACDCGSRFGLTGEGFLAVEGGIRGAGVGGDRPGAGIGWVSVCLSNGGIVSELELRHVIRAVDDVAKQGWKLLPQYSMDPDTGRFYHISTLTNMHQHGTAGAGGGTNSARGGQLGQHLTMGTPSVPGAPAPVSLCEVGREVVADAHMVAHTIALAESLPEGGGRGQGASGGGGGGADTMSARGRSSALDKAIAASARHSATAVDGRTVAYGLGLADGGRRGSMESSVSGASGHQRNQSGVTVNVATRPHSLVHRMAADPEAAREGHMRAAASLYFKAARWIHDNKTRVRNFLPGGERRWAATPQLERDRWFALPLDPVVAWLIASDSAKVVRASPGAIPAVDADTARLRADAAAAYESRGAAAAAAATSSASGGNTAGPDAAGTSTVFVLHRPPRKPLVAVPSHYRESCFAVSVGGTGGKAAPDDGSRSRSDASPGGGGPSESSGGSQVTGDAFRDGSDTVVGSAAMDAVVAKGAAAAAAGNVANATKRGLVAAGTIATATNTRGMGQSLSTGALKSGRSPIATGPVKGGATQRVGRHSSVVSEQTVAQVNTAAVAHSLGKNNLGREGKLGTSLVEFDKRSMNAYVAKARISRHDFHPDQDFARDHQHPVAPSPLTHERTGATSDRTMANSVATEKGIGARSGAAAAATSDKILSAASSAAKGKSHKGSARSGQGAYMRSAAAAVEALPDNLTTLARDGSGAAIRAAARDEVKVYRHMS